MYGKATTIVPPGEISVRLKRASQWGGNDDANTITPRSWRFRVLCGRPNCEGELRAGDDYAGHKMGGVQVMQFDDRLLITALYYPAVFVERTPASSNTQPPLIEHIRRTKPRAPSMYSPDARAKRLAFDRSPTRPDGSLWPEFGNVVLDGNDRRISTSYDIQGNHLPRRFRCPVCGVISMIAQEVVPMRASNAA